MEEKVFDGEEFADIFCICMESGYFTFKKAMSKHARMLEHYREYEPTYFSIGTTDSTGNFWLPQIQGESNSKFLYILHPLVKGGYIINWVISKFELDKPPQSMFNLIEKSNDDQYEFVSTSFKDAYDKLNELSYE